MHNFFAIWTLTECAIFAAQHNFHATFAQLPVGRKGSSYGTRYSLPTSPFRVQWTSSCSLNGWHIGASSPSWWTMGPSRWPTHCYPDGSAFWTRLVARLGPARTKPYPVIPRIRSKSAFVSVGFRSTGTFPVALLMSAKRVNCNAAVRKSTRWPLVWKTWKCQGFWQLSVKCQGFY